MNSFDVFAGVTDFCENYTPEVSKEIKTTVTLSAKENSSDSEAEGLFVQKKRLKQKSRLNETQKKSSAETGKGKKSPPADKEKTNSSGSGEIEEGIEENVLNEIFPEVQTRTRSRRRRSARTATTNANLSIEEYMQQQTERILSALVVPEPAHNQRGRARRRYMANLASAAPVTHVVDLAGPKTPPLPPITMNKEPITVDLDCEGDFSFLPLEPTNSSFDIENEEVSVKIKWGDQYEVIPLRRHQKFIDLLEELAKRKNVEAKDILLNLDDKIIRPQDTIDSINYTIAKFISGRIMESQEIYVPVKKKDPNMIKIKIQSDAFKKPLEVKVKKDQKFKILYVKCSEELKIPVDSIKLSFDGEPLNLNETPNDLELEGGEMIDCRIAK